CSKAKVEFEILVHQEPFVPPAEVSDNGGGIGAEGDMLHHSLGCRVVVPGISHTESRSHNRSDSTPGGTGTDAVLASPHSSPASRPQVPHQGGHVGGGNGGMRVDADEPTPPSCAERAIERLGYRRHGLREQSDAPVCAGAAENNVPCAVRGRRVHHDNLE